MLFSEPKIPQSVVRRAAERARGALFQCSSASRKFLNNALISTSSNSLKSFQCSSASRKFLNNAAQSFGERGDVLFQCSSASRKFLNRRVRAVCLGYSGFQCSSASRKFLNRTTRRAATRQPERVSVLFSEPKIPQSTRSANCRVRPLCFSALQRAENSSIGGAIRAIESLSSVSVLFSEPKIPQLRWASSVPSPRRAFQCSSASRKFLNIMTDRSNTALFDVSVLFSEPKIPQWSPPPARGTRTIVSVLFSEPKIPQSVTTCQPEPKTARVSVLFSEPKIPQSRFGVDGFVGDNPFQCSSASRKFLNLGAFEMSTTRVVSVSVLFSEPKIPQSHRCGTQKTGKARFSALQRAENSSMKDYVALVDSPHGVSVLFSEPKIPQFVVARQNHLALVVFQCSSASRKFLNLRRLSHARI